MNFYFKKKQLVLIFVPLLFLLLSCSPGKEKNNPHGHIVNSDTISIEIEHMLKDEFTLFYPLCIDTVYGGYFSDINYKWELDGRQDKMIVTQARHIWSTSNAAMFYNNNDFVKIAKHGFEFLKNKMWDKEYGGFYDMVDREGEPIKEGGEIIKRAYGNAFAIYGLAAYYKASGDTSALSFVKEAFNWFEKNSYDSEFGGYFQFMSQDGTPFKDGYRGTAPKDQNSSIHILESYTELYKVWKNPLLKERLNSLLHIIRDTITTDKGYLNLFFSRNWVPVSFKNSDEDTRNENYEFDHVSFGHDVETAYLLLEASEILGIKNDTTTLKIAKKMVDHVLNNGWDKEVGGIYDGGYYFGNEDHAKIIRDTKEWWAQAEALNSFLLMSDLFPNDKLNFYDKFTIQWRYIKKYLIDSQYGGWFWGGIDKVPNNKFVPKSTIWKCNYHTSRALINCLKRLKNSQK